MIKSIKNLGVQLNKKELQQLNGGDPEPCLNNAGGSCQNTHNMCDYWHPNDATDYIECMEAYECSCYYSFGSTGSTPIFDMFID